MPIETKWTPGPWELAQYEAHNGFSIWGPGAGCIAERWYPSATEEPVEANANLIAAAPELYEALWQFMDRAQSWHDFHHGTDISCDELCAAIAPAKAALAKARGEK